jgi:hypothetical protein
MKSMFNVKPFFSKVTTAFMSRSSEYTMSGKRTKRRSSNDSEDRQEIGCAGSSYLPEAISEGIVVR